MHKSKFADERSSCFKKMLTTAAHSSIIDIGGESMVKKEVPRIPELSASRITEKIHAGEYSTTLSQQQYLKHIEGTPQYEQYKRARRAKGQPPQSVLTISEQEAQQLIIDKAGTGIVDTDIKGNIRPREDITADKCIGKTWSGGKLIETNKARIYYGKDNSHIVPIGGMSYD